MEENQDYNQNNGQRPQKYCVNCGQQIDINAEICPKCGVRQPIQYQQSPFTQAPPDPNASDKDWATTLLLCVFLGYLGIHRFYTNNTGIGIGQLLTGGGCGIWWLIDLILLVTGKYKDGYGKFVKNN